MEVSSPGELIPPITLARLRARRSNHATRNPLIVRVLADAGIMRDEGEGIARIFDEMEENLLPPPEIEVEDGVFSVRLFNQPNAAGSDATSVTEPFFNSRLPSLREHFLRQSSLNNSDYRRIFGVSRYSAARELRRLVVSGFLRMVGKGRGAHYVPQPALNVARKRVK